MYIFYNFKQIIYMFFIILKLSLLLLLLWSFLFFFRHHHHFHASSHYQISSQIFLDEIIFNIKSFFNLLKSLLRKLFIQIIFTTFCIIWIWLNRSSNWCWKIIVYYTFFECFFSWIYLIISMIIIHKLNDIYICQHFVIHIR